MSHPDSHIDPSRLAEFGISTQALQVLSALSAAERRQPFDGIRRECLDRLIQDFEGAVALTRWAQTGHPPENSSGCSFTFFEVITEALDASNDHPESFLSKLQQLWATAYQLRQGNEIAESDRQALRRALEKIRTRAEREVFIQS